MTIFATTAEAKAFLDDNKDRLDLTSAEIEKLKEAVRLIAAAAWAKPKT